MELPSAFARTICRSKSGSDWPSCGLGTSARFEFSTADAPLLAPAGSRLDQQRFSDLLVGLVMLSNLYEAF